MTSPGRGDSLPFWLASLDSLDPGARGVGPWLLARPGLVNVLRAGFVVTTAAELVAPLCLIAPRLRRAWIPVIAGMHVMNRFTMKLFFWQNTTLILLLLSRPERWTPRVRARLGRLLGRRSSSAAEALDWLLRPADHDVVDVGAGTGQLSRLLVARGAAVTAVEPDSAMRRVLATRVSQARVTDGAAERLPVADRSQDAVLSHAAWHWFDPRWAVVEAARVLRPGGRLGALSTSLAEDIGWLDELWQRLEPGPDRDRRRPQATSTSRLAHFRRFGAPLAPFTRQQRHTVRFIRTATPNELVGLMATYSGLIVCADDERSERLEAVRELIERRFPGREPIELRVLTHCWRAERRR